MWPTGRRDLRSKRAFTRSRPCTAPLTRSSIAVTSSSIGRRRPGSERRRQEMMELRFHRDVYAGEAVDEAVKVYARFASFELAQESAYWVVRIQAQSESRERAIAGELGNFALGVTMGRGSP